MYTLIRALLRVTDFFIACSHRKTHGKVNRMARPDKAAAVAELTEDFKSASATYLTEYRGLTVTSMKQLRRSLGADAKIGRAHV